MIRLYAVADSAPTKATASQLTAARGVPHGPEDLAKVILAFALESAA